MSFNNDNTFIWLAVIISILLPLVFVFAKPSISDAATGMLAVILLDLLCYMAHGSINRGTPQ